MILFQIYLALLMIYVSIGRICRSTQVVLGVCCLVVSIYVIDDVLLDHYLVLLLI